MPSSFGQNFLAGYNASQQAQRARQREEMERQQLALERQRTLHSIAAQDATAKAQEIERQQQDVDDALKHLELQDRPQVPVSAEAGGVGPPAEGPRQILQRPQHDGSKLSIPARYRGDVQQDALDTMQQQGQAKIGLAVQQETAMGPAEAQSAKLKAEAEFPTQAKLAAIKAAHANQGQFANDPQIQATVQDAADRVVSGEMTVDQARGLLGGVKGGLGPALIRALGDRKVVPAGVRKDLQSIQTTRNIVDQMEELVGEVVGATTAKDRATATLKLEQYGQTTGTLLSRGFGERGVVTDKDVTRATGLVPGWKAANFAPEYAAQEIKLLHDTLDRNERSISEGYFKTLPRSGNLSAPKQKMKVGRFQVEVD